jgi:hypothetical protein
MAVKVIIGCVVTIKYYIYVVKPHLTWMDKKLAFFVGAPRTHTFFSIAMDLKCNLGLFRWRLGAKSSVHVENGLFERATYNNNIQPIGGILMHVGYLFYRPYGYGKAPSFVFLAKIKMGLKIN